MQRNPRRWSGLQHVDLAGGNAEDCEWRTCREDIEVTEKLAVQLAMMTALVRGRQAASSAWGVTRNPVWMDVTAQLTAPPAAATTPRWPGQAGWVTITRSPASRITDDVYEAFVYDSVHTPLLAAAPDMREHCITVNSVSKAHAMTGWGWLSAPPEIIEEATRMVTRTLTHTPQITQAAALEAIRGNQSVLEVTRNAYRARPGSSRQAVSRVIVQPWRSRATARASD